MRSPRIEPEAAGDGEVNASALMYHISFRHRPCDLRVVIGEKCLTGGAWGENLETLCSTEGASSASHFIDRR